MLYNSNNARINKQEEYLQNVQNNITEIFAHHPTENEEDTNSENMNKLLKNRVIHQDAMDDSLVFDPTHLGKVNVREIFNSIVEAKPYINHDNFQAEKQRISDDYEKRKIELNDEQKQFLSNLENDVTHIRNNNEVITDSSQFRTHLVQAPGGCGKTFMLNHFAANHLDIKIVFSAFTGNAASKQLHGRTLHSLCNLDGKQSRIPDEDDEFGKHHKTKKSQYETYPSFSTFDRFQEINAANKNLQVLVVDEVSGIFFLL